MSGENELQNLIFLTPKPVALVLNHTAKSYCKSEVSDSVPRGVTDRFHTVKWQLDNHTFCHVTSWRARQPHLILAFFRDPLKDLAFKSKGADVSSLLTWFWGTCDWRLQKQTWLKWDPHLRLIDSFLPWVSFGKEDAKERGQRSLSRVRTCKHAENFSSQNNI